MTTTPQPARGDGVELQINLAPTDLPHARMILPHQLRTWAGQVDSVQLTLDLHRSHGRYAAAWRERAPGMRALLEETAAVLSNARVVPVDYSPAAAVEVSARFFAGNRVPAKDMFGAPFFAYFFALARARQRFVLHMDSDMLFGGGSERWLAEATSTLQTRPEVFACNPLPGPPAADGQLRSQHLEGEPDQRFAFRSPAISTRIFLVDMNRVDQVAPFPLLRPGRLRSLQCALEAHPPYRCAEECISAAMRSHGLVRVDMLGTGTGMWAIHPPYRSERFYATLPQLVARVQAGDIPEQQRGRHDVDDSLVNWSDVRPTALRRLGSHARVVASRLAG